MIKRTRQRSEWEKPQTKQLIKNWLFALDEDERFQVFAVSNQEILEILSFMIRYLLEKHNEYLFGLHNGFVKQAKPQSNFYMRIRITQVKNQEITLLEALRICWGLQKPVFVICRELLSNLQVLWNILDLLSGGNIFRQTDYKKFAGKQFTSIQDHIFVSYWLNPYNYHTVCSWIVLALQINILYKYFNRDSSFLRTPISPDLEDFQIFLTHCKDFKSKYFPKQLFDIHVPIKEQAEYLIDQVRKANKKDLVFRCVQYYLRKRSQKRQCDFIQFKLMQKAVKLMLHDYMQQKQELRKKMEQKIEEDKKAKISKNKKRKQRAKKKQRTRLVKEEQRAPQQQNKKSFQPIQNQDQVEQLKQAASTALMTSEVGDQLLQQEADVQKERQLSNLPRLKQVEKEGAKSVSQSKKRRKNQKRESIGKMSQRAADKWLTRWIDKLVKEQSDQISIRANQVIAHREEVLTFLKHLLFGYMGIAQVSLYGSCACGLALRCSDIDVVFLSKEDKLRQLSVLQQKLNSFQFIKKSVCYQSAKVPILRFEFSLNDICQKVDISACQSDLQQHSGVRATRFMNQHNKKHQSLLASLIVLKQSFKRAGLLNLYEGGLSSFMLYLLVLAFYQQHNKSDFSRLVQFYGTKFNPKRTMVCPNQPKAFLDFQVEKDCPLSLKEPLGKTMIGQGCTRIAEVLTHFGTLHKRIQDVKKQVLSQIRRLSKQQIQSYNRGEKQIKITEKVCNIFQ